MINQRPRCVGCRNVAADDLDVREIVLDPTDPVKNTLRMSMCGIDNNDIDPGFCQQRGTFLCSRADTNGRTHPKPTGGILAGIRVFSRLDDILDRDQPT